MKKTMLAIETSCDETALSLVEGSGDLKSKTKLPTFTIKKALISSQIKIHRPFGGVVPNIAKREHLKALPLLLKKIKITLAEKKKIDAIVVTSCPGLEPALWTGIEFAKKLGVEWDKPVLGVNHLEGHLLSFLLAVKNAGPKKVFPAIGLIVSGGHTILLKMNSLTEWQKLGETQDDAVGEAFDKVARMLGLPYPGGPEIQKLADKGDCKAIDFPQPMKYHKNYNFSFSGLKTSVLYFLKKNPKVKKADVAASFERAATDVLVYKTYKAVKEYGGKSVILCGGVAANAWLRKKLKQGAQESKINFFVPEFEFNTDNATMIGIAGYINMLQHKSYPLIASSDVSI